MLAIHHYWWLYVNTYTVQSITYRIAFDECGTHKILTSKTDEFVVGFIGEKISREKL